MDEERRRDFAVTQYTEIDETGGIKVQLPEWLGEDLPVLGRLYHRVVDVLVVDEPEWLLIRDVEKALTFLTTEMVSKYVTNLISKAQKDVKAETEAASKSNASARAARKRKAATKTEKKTNAAAPRRKEVADG